MSPPAALHGAPLRRSRRQTDRDILPSSDLPGPMMGDLVVDWHAHWVPSAVVALLSERTAFPCVVREGDRRWFLPAAGVRRPLKESQLDLDFRRAEMDRTGVSRQVLSLAVVLGSFLADLPDAMEGPLVDANNRGLARLVKEDGARFAGLAALPMRDPAEAARVLERAVVGQGLQGAILPSDALADRETASRFSDVFAVAHRLRAHLFIHPAPLPGAGPGGTGLIAGQLAGYGGDPDDNDPARMLRRRAISFQESLTAATVTLEYSDFLDPFGDAVIHVANLGGAMALYADRIAMTAGRMGLPDRWADGRLRRTVVDTASFGSAGIRLAASTFGTERLLFGTDSPALELAPALAGVEEAGLAGPLRRALLSGAAISTLAHP